MIVPMKKVSLIIRGDGKNETLKKLRKLGIVQIEIAEGSGDRLEFLSEQVALLEGAVYLLGKAKNVPQETVSAEKAQELAAKIAAKKAEQEKLKAELIATNAELDRIKDWGEIDPRRINELRLAGYSVSIYEMPKGEYASLPDTLKTVRLAADKHSVKFLIVSKNEEDGAEALELKGYQFTLPKASTSELRQTAEHLRQQMNAIDSEIAAYSCYTDSIKNAIKVLLAETEFETYATGMENEELSSGSGRSVSVAYFTGYIEAENTEQLRKAAAQNAWGLLIEDPTPEDNVPTKLKNNKFVSLIYPLTDFLGTVPGYFEYDISGWFLAFILIFFGIIFGDGGYGLLITAVAAIPIVSALIKRKPVSPMLLLVGLFGLSTVLWGTLTCTWFGLAANQLPVWLQRLSVPVISNVYADKLWYPFWTGGEAALTTAQNLQIFCFTLALVQLSIAHIKGLLRNKGTLKMLGDIGSILQLVGIYYLVLSLVVNAQVFSFSLIIAGIPVGTVAIALIAIGFVLSFVFSNYEGSVIKAILSSLTNIVSVLLGVVNVFSDIVSYIRLWAVGLAGAAISATVNELAGPLLGNFMFMIIAIVLLVFGHGLNMILNVLSVIVHGIRLNTLEFSSHLDMSWSGHKFEPFEEKIN